MTVFDFKQYYDLALELDKSNNEANKRSSISRSYYSAYIVCREFIKSNDCFLNGECKEILLRDTSKAHSEVRKVFLDYHYTHNRRSMEFRKKNSLGKKIHDRLHDLREHRNNADYQNEFKKLKFYSDYCLKISKYIHDNLDDFL